MSGQLSMTSELRDPAPAGHHPGEAAAERPAYFPALDGMRFLCAAGVIVDHAYMVPAIEAQPTHPLYPLITQLGGVGVDLFFCLSGFLITYLLLGERAQLGGVNLKYFYIRRTLRIFPNYYLAVLAAFGATVALGAFSRSSAAFGSPSLGSLLAHLVFLGNWTEAPHLAGPLWSVCVEEQFYLLFPITWVFARRPRPVLLVAFIGVTISVVTRALVDWPVSEVFHRTITRTDHLLLGATLAQLFHDAPARVAGFFRRLGGTGEFIGLMALGVFIQTLAWRDATPAGRNASFFVSALISTFLVGQLGLGGGPVARLLGLRIPRFLGQLTYATYCFHAFALVPTFLVVNRLPLDPWVAGALRSVMAIPIAFGIAYVCRVTYEQRILNLKDRFHPRKKKRPELVPGA